MNTTFFGTQVGKGPFTFGHQLCRFPGQVDFIPGAIDHDAQLIRLKGFGNKVISPLLHGFNGSLHRGKTGNDDDQDLFIMGLYPGKSLHAVHAWHFKIQKNNIDRLPADNIESVFPATGLEDPAAHAGKYPL